MGVCDCVLVSLTNCIPVFKHSQVYIKFDETYLLGINSSVFFFFSLIGFKSFIFVCSNMYKGSALFSLLCFFSFFHFTGVSLALYFFLLIVV